MAASGSAGHTSLEEHPQEDTDGSDRAARVIAEELESLRTAFDRGAEFALTRAGRRDETLHRLECPSLEPQLSRDERWTDEHRLRLAEDPEYRIPLPALLTRAEAAERTDVRACRVCWPNLSGREPRPLKRLAAQSLRQQHVGRVLATASGESLGTIIRVARYHGADLFGVEHDEIEVTTSVQVLRFERSDEVHLWDLPSDSEALDRKMRMFARFGDPVSGPR